MQQLGNIAEGAARALFGSFVREPVTLAADDTAASKVKTTGAIKYVIDGIFKTDVTALNDQAYTTGHDTLLDGFSCLFVWAVNAAGAVVSFQGPAFKVEGAKFRGYKTCRDSLGAVTGYVQELALVDYNSAFLPSIPSGYAPFGVNKVAASGANFVPGTTAHGTNNTATFYDVTAMPASTTL